MPVCNLQLASHSDSFVSLALLLNPSKPTRSGLSAGHGKSKHQVRSEPSFFKQISEEKGSTRWLSTRALLQEGSGSSREHFHQQERQICSHFAFPFSNSSLMSRISLRLIVARLTTLAPPINPIRELQKTGPGSPARNRKITGSEFRSTNKEEALHRDSGLPWAAICEQRKVQSILQKAVGASWKSSPFPHNLSTGHPQATSLKVMVGT